MFDLCSERPFYFTPLPLSAYLSLVGTRPGISPDRTLEALPRSLAQLPAYGMCHHHIT
jgi:hypothetical protein